MKKIISLDFWGTLAKSNPKFKEEQFKVARQYEPELTFVDFKARFKAIKLLTDEKVEARGIQPDRVELYHEMFPNWNRSIISEFIQYSDILFLKHPPIVIEKMGELVEKWKNEGCKLHICSNTVFIHGEVLSKVVFDLFGIVRSNCNFSDEVGYSKPHSSMFRFPRKPDFHIGDNPITDGSCENVGIEYIKAETLVNEFKTLVGKLSTTF